jgi:hypothetical protein
MYSISAGLFHKNKYSWILLSLFAQNALAPTVQARKVVVVVVFTTLMPLLDLIWALSC